MPRGPELKEWKIVVYIDLNIVPQDHINQLPNMHILSFLQDTHIIFYRRCMEESEENNEHYAQQALQTRKFPDSRTRSVQPPKIHLPKSADSGGSTTYNSSKYNNIHSSLL